MKTRDEYVAKLKTRLDQWNAEAARWEAQAKATKEKQLEAFNQRRDEALYQLKLLEGAAASARTYFEKSSKPKSKSKA
jgi:lipid II:glycine glycyltransferase (peptidoglycan interpeptide bridge formation enzyme)